MASAGSPPIPTSMLGLGGEFRRRGGGETEGDRREGRRDGVDPLDGKRKEKKKRVVKKEVRRKGSVSNGLNGLDDFSSDDSLDSLDGVDMEDMEMDIGGDGDEDDDDEDDEDDDEDDDDDEEEEDDDEDDADDDDDDEDDDDDDDDDDYDSLRNDEGILIGTSRLNKSLFKKKKNKSDEDPPTQSDDTLTTVYENEFNNISDSDLLSDFGLREGDVNRSKRADSGLSLSVPQQSIDAISAMSQEDDSDIEEDLKYAARQIKRKTLGGITESSSSTLDLLLLSESRPSSLVPQSPNKSTRVRATTVGTTANANNGKRLFRQRSLDIGLNNLPSSSNKAVLQAAAMTATAIGSSTISSTSRRMSNPVPPVRTLSSRTLSSINQILDSKEQEQSGSSRPPVSRRNTDASVSSANLIPEIFPSDEALLSREYLQRSKSSSNGSINVISQVMLPPLPPLPTPPAKLSTLIKAKLSSFDNPLEQYISASGKSERNPCRLKFYMPSCNEPKVPWEVIVRTDANVASAIGFALYCYQQKTRSPALAEDKCDANKWNLRIIEDDGEPDEDFPALDRTRIISAYSFDEFALVEATAEQARENERITPNSRKPIMKPPPSRSTSSADHRHHPHALTAPTSTTTKNTDEVLLRVFQFPFNELVSPLFWSATVAINIKIEQVLESICKDKVLDANMYMLKIAGTRLLAINSLDLSSLQGKYNLELTPKRIITIENGYDTSLLSIISRRNSSPLSSAHNLNSAATKKRLGTTSTSNSSSNIFSTLEMRGGSQDFKAASAGHNRLPSSILPEGFLNGSSAGYQKYMIWRRQPMSFISRHERVLAIDGEYVHIMPSEDRTFFDSPKTSSFHIGQIIKCKQSQKVPTNFKVVVMKTNGPKRYDLEAVSVAESAEIVAKLRALSQKYRQN